MGLVTIKDDVIWFSHLSDDPPLLHRLMSLVDGEAVQLEIDGIDGEWVRMASGKDGRPTMGIRPVGTMVDVWRAYYRDRKGQTVRVQVATTARPPRQQMGEEAAVYRRDEKLMERSDGLIVTIAERDAAFQALMDMHKLGYKSDGPYGSRDELYDRDDRDA